MTMSIRVFLVDDHEVVRRGVRDLLEQCDDIEVVGEAATAEEALSRIPPTRPDVAVIDMRLPDGNGVEVYVDESDVWRKEPQRRTFEELVTRMVELTAPSLGRTGTKDCSY